MCAVRGHGASTALISCDFVPVEGSAVVGLYTTLLPLLNPISFKPSQYFISTLEASKALLQVLIMEAVPQQHLL